MFRQFSVPASLQIRVVIDSIESPVWRRLIVPADWHLGELHLAIQAAFNWWNCHLHEFRIGGLRFGDTDVEDGLGQGDPKIFDEREVQLLDFGGEPGLTFAYIYDFGDNWRHTVTIEQSVDRDARPRRASCVDGARARPPEDVGGVEGYQQFLTVMADPGHPEHRDTRRWCGGYFDPEWFDCALVDKDIGAALKPDVRRRLHQPKPKPARRRS